MRVSEFDDPHYGPTGVPIEISGEGWIAQTRLWARAVAAISLLAGGAVMLVADWNVTGMPAQFYMALIWGGPSIIYFTLSFFVERARGNVCAAMAIIAGVHALATLGAPLLIGQNPMAALVPPVVIAGNRQALPWYFLLALALVAGLVNLIVSSLWSRRFMRHSHVQSRARGFEVMEAREFPRAPHSILSDLEK